MPKSRKTGRNPRHGAPYGRPAAPPRPDAPPATLNATEHADRRQNAVNAAARSLTTARKQHSAALAKFNETSPTSADAEIVAGDLRAATKELSDAWKGFHDLAGNLS